VYSHIFSSKFLRSSEYLHSHLIYKKKCFSILFQMVLKAWHCCRVPLLRLSSLCFACHMAPKWLLYECGPRRCQWWLGSSTPSEYGAYAYFAGVHTFVSGGCGPSTISSPSRHFLTTRNPQWIHLPNSPICQTSS
jgi:hypothetical protein